MCGFLKWQSGLAGNSGMGRNALDKCCRAEADRWPFAGSLLWADGQFLCLGELGHLLWLELTPKGCKEISRARLFLARESWTLPVLSRGLLYVCQNSRDILTGAGPRLLCYDLRGGNDSAPAVKNQGVQKVPFGVARALSFSYFILQFCGGSLTKIGLSF